MHAWHARGLAAAMAALLLATGAAWAADEAVVAIDLARAEADELGDGGWGERQEADGKAFRVAEGGRPSVLRTDAWWKEGLRPAEGEYWLAEIEYKDTAEAPIVFDVYAGLSTFGSRTEMHRFGGLNDGEWKTAQVPLPWDMLMVAPGTRKVEMGLRSREDVPVASVRIVPLAKEDLAKAAERWNAETREWTARVQKRHADAKRTDLAEPQKPAESVASGDQPVVPYVRSYLEVVYRNSAPQEGETGKSLAAEMALNEYEPAAFGVYANQQDLHGVQVTVSPLKHESDARASLDVEAMTAEYALVQARGGSLALYPQRLWPMYATDIPKGQSGWFWLTFRSDPGRTKAGLYRGEVRIRAEEGSATLPVEVRVLPIELVDMSETDLRMGGCITGMVSRHEMEEMLRHNHNMVQYWFSGVQPRFVVKDDKTFTLDFTILDDAFEQARKAGIVGNVYFLGGNPYSFPSTHTLARELARQVLGMTMEQYTALMWDDPHNMPESIAPLYAEWVRQYTEHAKAKGWPEQILTPFDEPDKWRQRRDSTGPWIRPQFEQACKLIHEGSPDTRVYISAHHAPATLFIPVVDIYCTNAIQENAKLGDIVREAGKVFWQYSGTDAAAPPDRARFTFGFYFNAFDSRGSLVWAYNWGSRFDTTEGDNWMYAWYTPLDVIPAPYYEGMREAWDDRRYVETLRKVAGQKNADISDFLEKLSEDGRALRGRGGEDTVYDFWDQAKHPSGMDALRDRVARKILELQQAEDAAVAGNG